MNEWRGEGAGERGGLADLESELAGEGIHYSGRKVLRGEGGGHQSGGRAPGKSPSRSPQTNAYKIFFWRRFTFFST